MKKLKIFDLGYLIGGAQNYLVFQSVFKYFTLNNKWITKWKSKGLSNKGFKVVSETDNTLTPSINYYGDKVRSRFTGSVLLQKNNYIQS